jgi:hypothetical protein
MKVVRFEKAEEFLDRAGPWLAQAEAENNLILGICSDLASHLERFEADPYLLAIENEVDLVGAALMTPPRSLIVTRAPAVAVRRLADYLIRIGAAVPGVLGPSATAKVFAEYWVEKRGSRCRQGMSQRTYKCDRVVLPDRGPGHLRAALDDDLPLLAEWRGEFCREVGHAEEDDHRAAVENFLADRRLYVWEHHRTVSMAGLAGETVSGLRVGMVYTPPDLRGRGYATSCVASLTKRLLDSGKSYCFLAADLANPTSNGIYREIGYRPVCDSQTWHFD